MNPTLPDRTREPSLRPLAGGPFLLWPLGVLRSAGFPLADLLRLGDESYLAAVDEAIAAGQSGVSPEISVAAERRQFDTLRAIAGRPRFREAVAWQNHALVRPMIDGLADSADDKRRNEWLRRRERIVARYLARYCAKNDTIGFTGPATWMRLTDRDETITAEPGPGLDIRRRVCSENWAIEALATAMVRDPALRRRIPPRLHPAYRQLGPMLLRSDAAPEMLAPVEAAVLARCDGRTELTAIAEALVAAGTDGISGPADVEKILDSLAERRFIRIDLEPPLLTHPEVPVREALERMRPESLPALAVLDRWQAATDRVAEVPPEDLITALEDLSALFVELTGEAPQRHEGQAYGGRGLIYLDSDRDLDATIGARLFDGFGEALTSVLLTGRWLTDQIGRHYRGVFTRTYQALAEANPGRPIGYNEMIYTCAAEVFGDDTPMDKIIADFARRWCALLGMDTAGPDVHELRFTSAELAERVAGAFEPSRPGWTQAHLSSVDLQIAAPDIDAVRRGELFAVLGEAHFCWNAVESAALVESCQERDELKALLHRGLPGPRIGLVPVKQYPRVTPRTVSAIDEADWHLAVTDDPGMPFDRQLALAELMVEMTDDRLWVRTYDRRVWMDPIDACGMQIAEDVTDALKHVARQHPHSPRVTVDRLVVFRETWNVPIADIPLHEIRTEAEHFVATRRWAAALGLPRFVFVSVPGESKPFYVDFASSVIVASLASTIRRTAETAEKPVTIMFSEMMPAPGQQWVPDADGATYTGELRLQLVDPAEPGDPGRVWTVDHPADA